MVYCEIDSLLPEVPAFEFLRKSSFRPAVDQGDVFRRPAGFRIKTVKLRGQVSQGICFPLSVLPEGAPTEIGADVTELLGVTKYEAPPPAGMSGRVLGGFPGWLPKTDETRVQVLTKLLEKYAGTELFLTEKLDGSSMSAYLDGGVLNICSRNLRLDPTDGEHLFVRLANALQLADKLAALEARLGVPVAVQGEVIGPGVQQNRYGLPQHELRVFNVLDRTTSKLVDRQPALDALDAAGLARVPELGPLVLSHGVDELVALSVGMSALNTKVHREGIVLRPASEVSEWRLGGRLSFKAINPQFLLKYDE